MRYWLYSEGNIIGPYSVEELAALPSFSPTSLVCPESSTGTNPQDWRNAYEIKEIADLVKVGILTEKYTEYEENDLNTNDLTFDSITERDTDASYSNLLNTIDNILNNYKSEKDKEKKIEIKEEFDIIDKFDIRLAKIQEELEAARWEKNVLLERLRLKEEEEKKDKQRIEELERKLSELLKKLENEEKVVYIEKREQEDENKKLQEKIEKIKEINETISEKLEKVEETSLNKKQVEEKRLSEKDEKSEESKEIVKTEKSEENEKFELPKEKKNLKKLSSLKISSDIFPERIIDNQPQKEKEDFTLNVGKLKSFGYERPERIFKEEVTKKEEKKEELKPLQEQTSKINYDFTIVPSRFEVENVEKIKIEPEVETNIERKIESKIEPKVEFKVERFDKPLDLKTEEEKKDVKKDPSLSPEIGGRFISPLQQKIENPENLSKENLAAFQPPQFKANQNLEVSQKTVVFTEKTEVSTQQRTEVLPQQKTEVFHPKESEINLEKVENKDSEKIKEQDKTQDKTIRIPVPPSKQEEVVKANEGLKKNVKVKSRIKFLSIIFIFVILVVGGIFYFFSGKKTNSNIAMNTKSETITSTVTEQGQNTINDKVPVVENNQQQQNSNLASLKSSENVKKSIEIVKNYNLSDGRGTISNWFMNNFASSKQVNDEWSSTLLQNNIYVVQYRVIRPRQEPLVYQFEVDVEKGTITRGINNNAIELLESVKKEIPKKDLQIKLPPKSKTKKLASKISKKQKELPLLPLPEKEENNNLTEPTGFENSESISTGKVKIKAPETDEELF